MQCTKNDTMFSSNKFWESQNDDYKRLNSGHVAEGCLVPLYWAIWKEKGWACAIGDVFQGDLSLISRTFKMIAKHLTWQLRKWPRRLSPCQVWQSGRRQTHPGWELWRTFQNIMMSTRWNFTPICSVILKGLLPPRETSVLSMNQLIRSGVRLSRFYWERLT